MSATKAFANNILDVGPSGQPTAVQNRFKRFCRGELTADWRNTNPDLISGDNSAKALLAKIKAERGSLSKKAKAKA
ncbi:hypothetical protein [Rheinheimera sp.]|uniref:hypothetical protein n=1 Tax=Rheinheimera sp. TaxID=1869214 RepID=UPI00307DF40A